MWYWNLKQLAKIIILLIIVFLRIRYSSVKHDFGILPLPKTLEIDSAAAFAICCCDFFLGWITFLVVFLISMKSYFYNYWKRGRGTELFQFLWGLLYWLMRLIISFYLTLNLGFALMGILGLCDLGIKDTLEELFFSIYIMFILCFLSLIFLSPLARKIFIASISFYDLDISNISEVFSEESEQIRKELNKYDWINHLISIEPKLNFDQCFVNRIGIFTFRCSTFRRTYAEKEDGNRIHSKMVAWECWGILKPNR